MAKPTRRLWRLPSRLQSAAPAGRPITAPPSSPSTATASSPGDSARRSWMAGMRVPQAANTNPVMKKTTVVAARARRSSSEAMPIRYPASAMSIYPRMPLGVH
jgi:hypothetical protein